MVPPNSRKISRVPRYLGTRPREMSLFAYRTFTFYGYPSDDIRLKASFVTLRLQCAGAMPGPTTPRAQRTHAWHARGLGCSPFARRYLGNRSCFLFLQVLRWFTSLGSLPHPMDSDEDDEGLPRRVSPFGHLRVKACLAAHRSLSQLATSFIAVLRQGIHRMPLVA